MANFDPATGALVFASNGSLEDRALVQPDRNNFGPRVGLVYQVNRTTVVRGGYGIFYNPLDRIGSEDQLALNPPGLRNINITTTSTTTPVIFLKDGFPPNYLDPSNIVLSRLLIRAANPSGENARYQQVAVGVERQIGRQVRRSRPTSSATSATTSRCCAISTSRRTATAPGRTRISPTSSGGIRSGRRGTSVSICRRKSGSRTDSATA